MSNFNLDMARSYATRANAVRVAESAAAAYGLDLRYVVAVREDGRFVPFAVLTPDQIRWARALAERGVYLTN